ncbi:hypothetical protein [Brachyspira aalborgi]|jgi:hypothetical protein|uniref:Uncharacterized protein n=1 Tax=Brachyspira aalborgi TaxID=29522 RepID=A0ABY3K6J4_9SPIR|nr:hypothetical protein [Brachyspira aalborgi]TXJ31142.1 hypothetical protein EPJ71_10435 [Brachyspira aalborgi]TXJ40032.1 hypothetical protein EPJ65_12375 [Brachyspira aalborgi]DAZ18878.1 MAG TPA: hypothetical protein [Caudoviricetes sp.]
MDDKEIINESIKVADVLAKELSFWKRLFIYACSVLLSVLIVFGILAYIYIYNTETIIETTTQDGFQTQYKGSNNITITTSDITNDNIIKILEGRDGKTNY